jgi:hypothetical protein
MIIFININSTLLSKVHNHYLPNIMMVVMMVAMVMTVMMGDMRDRN